MPQDGGAETPSPKQEVIPVSKRTYRALDIKSLNVAELVELTKGRLVIGVDVAKFKPFAALLSAERECVRIVNWSMPCELDHFVALCTQVRDAGVDVAVVMEPSGTYGDALRARLLAKGIEVFRVSGKRVNGSAEVFDGVPSKHDAKDAVLIARLHFETHGSEPWPLPDAVERELEAHRQVLTIQRERFESHRNRLEALMARYWPELCIFLGFKRKSVLHLLATFGGPAGVAAEPLAAAALMRTKGRSFLDEEVIQAVVASASKSFGVPMLQAELELVRHIAAEALDAHGKMKPVTEAIVKRAEQSLKPTLTALVGMVTAASLVACGLAPTKYVNASALQKAFGLNLREFSSGTKKGGLHISKRGDSMARQLLYLAALRLIKAEPIVAAWYRKKVAREGGHRKRLAVVAVMRKLSKALWHVGRGAEFDAAKLFNVNKLGSVKPLEGANAMT